MIFRVKIVKYEYAEGKTKEDAAMNAIENMNETNPCVKLLNVEKVVRVAETWEELNGKKKV